MLEEEERNEMMKETPPPPPPPPPPHTTTFRSSSSSSLSSLVLREWPWWKVLGGTAGFTAYLEPSSWTLEKLKQPLIIALAFAIISVFVAVDPVYEYLASGVDVKAIGWMYITVSVVSSRSHVLSMSVVFRRSVGSGVGVAYALGVAYVIRGADSYYLTGWLLIVATSMFYFMVMLVEGESASARYPYQVAMLTAEIVAFASLPSLSPNELEDFAVARAGATLVGLAIIGTLQAFVFSPAGGVRGDAVHCHSTVARSLAQAVKAISMGAREMSWGMRATALEAEASAIEGEEEARRGAERGGREGKTRAAAVVAATKALREERDAAMMRMREAASLRGELLASGPINARAASAIDAAISVDDSVEVVMSPTLASFPRRGFADMSAAVGLPDCLVSRRLSLSLLREAPRLASREHAHRSPPSYVFLSRQKRYSRERSQC